jgi:hypothetical protein
MKRLIIFICLLFFAGYSGYSQYLIPLYANGNAKGGSSNNNYSTTIVFGQNVIGISKNNYNNTYFGLLAPIVFTTGTDDFTRYSSSPFILYQNYPNPFKDKTMITFDLKKRSLVKLTVYDIFGQQIKQYYNQELSPGKYSNIFNANKISQGIYFYQIKIDNYLKTKSMLLVK